ncbi:hypothetical protein NBRC3222_1352 [Acetobacter pasteurianus NBRC 3222]|nr:hypothetical protein NBRC3222_1352 [Acetobacter pasteurianus NBRC 3222]
MQRAGRPVLEPVPRRGLPVGKQRVFLGPRKRRVLERFHPAFGNVLFLPAGPEFFGCAAGAIAPVMPGNGEQQLAVGKKLGDFILVLIADALGNSGVHGRAFARLAIRTLGLDHGQRNTVDEADNIRPAGLGQIRAQDAEFLGEGKAVVLRVLPVDQRDGRIGLAPVDELGNGNAEQQMRGHLVIGVAQAGHEIRMRDV